MSKLLHVGGDLSIPLNGFLGQEVHKIIAEYYLSIPLNGFKR